LTIKWNAPEIIYKDGTKFQFTTPQDHTEKYQGVAYGQNSEIVDLEVGETLYGEENMRGGEQIALTVTCTTKVDAKEYKTNPDTIKNPFIIKGRNPDTATLLAELDEDKYIAVAYYESGRTFHQFNDDGYPLQIPMQPRIDFGVMQISTPWIYPTWEYNGSDEYNDYRCDDIVWNWVTNVQQGKLMLSRRFNLAKSYEKKFEDAAILDADQQLKEGYCEYNAGPRRYYWSWVPSITFLNIPIRAGYWERNDIGAKKATIDGRNYADAVWKIYYNKSWQKK
jgi:hypothetical protein